jgi:hypothetical protein
MTASLVLAQNIGAVEVVVSAAFVTLCALVFCATGRWWRTQGGPLVACFLSSLGAVLDLAAVRVVFGAGLDTPWFVWVRVAVFAALPIVLAWAFGVILTVQIIRPYRERSTLRIQQESGLVDAGQHSRRASDHP